MSPIELFVKMPILVVRDKSISSGERDLYEDYLYYARGKGECFPGDDTLSRDLGKDARQIRRLRKGLASKGLISVMTRGRNRCIISITPLEDVYGYSPESHSYFNRQTKEVVYMAQNVLGEDSQGRTRLQKGVPPAPPSHKTKSSDQEVDPITGEPLRKKEKVSTESAERKRRKNAMLNDLVKSWRLEYERIFGIESMGSSITGADRQHVHHVLDRVGGNKETAWSILEYALRNWGLIRANIPYAARLEAPTLRVVDALKDELKYAVVSGKGFAERSLGTGVHRADLAGKEMDDLDKCIAEAEARLAARGTSGGASS